MKFGHLAQKNQDIISFDLSNLSLHLGTEAAGILGFETLHMLQIKIDYRDGLVDFVYDAKTLGAVKVANSGSSLVSDTFRRNPEP